MRLYFQKSIFICLITILGIILFSPNVGLSAETNSLSKTEIENHLIFPEKDTHQLLHGLIGIMGDQWENLLVSARASEEEMLVPLIIRQGLQIDILKYLMLDAPLDMTAKIVRQGIKIAYLTSGFTSGIDASTILEEFEKITVKMAVDKGMKFLLQNEIRVAPGVLEVKYISKKGNPQQAIFQYVLAYKPTDQKQGEVNLEIYSPQSLEPPQSKGSLTARIGTPNALETNLPAFMVKVQGRAEKGEYGVCNWIGTPEIEISFPDNVPDLGFRPMSFWQRHLWKPIESQIRETTVLLGKLLPDGNKIVTGIKNIGQKIYQAGSAIKNVTTNLFGKINNYFQASNTGASIAGFVYPNPQNITVADNLALPNDNAPKEQLTTIIEPPTSAKAVLQNEAAAPDQLSIIQAKLNALIDHIDDIAEEADILFASQNQMANENNVSEGDLAASKPSQESAPSTRASAEPQLNSSTSTTTSNQPQNITLSNQLTGNQPAIIVPPPPAPEIIISEVKTESQNSAKDEYIELYNPNKFTVDLGGFILHKKAATGAESTLVSSAKFKGIIPAFGYFLITPQSTPLETRSLTGSTATSNLPYSSAGYYIAQTNSILLYDKYERLLDKAENVIHPATHSFGRKITGSADPSLKYQNSGSSPSAGASSEPQPNSSGQASDFEIQSPTPGTDNQRDTEVPQITITTKPTAITSTTTAAFAFSANEPGCSFEYQLDSNPWQQSNGDPVAAKFDNLATGQHSFQIRAQDAVSNWATPLQYFWEIVVPAESVAEAAEPKILISEIQTESASSSQDEFIELFNPNNFNVDLNGFALKKKTSSGAESNLVSSSHFTGIIAGLGYFLITPPPPARQQRWGHSLFGRNLCNSPKQHHSALW